jgi:hypothetical protein
MDVFKKIIWKVMADEMIKKSKHDQIADITKKLLFYYQFGLCSKKKKKNYLVQMSMKHYEKSL